MDAAGVVSLTRLAVRATGQVVAGGFTLIALRDSTEAVEKVRESLLQVFEMASDSGPDHDSVGIDGLAMLAVT